MINNPGYRKNNMLKIKRKILRLLNLDKLYTEKKKCKRYIEEKIKKVNKKRRSCGYHN